MVLLANLFGLLLDERGERVDVAGDILSGFFLGRDQRVVETFDLLVFGLVHAVQGEVRGGRCASGSRSGGVAYAIDRMMLSFVFLFRDTNPLNGENRVLRATIAL